MRLIFRAAGISFFLILILSVVFILLLNWVMIPGVEKIDDQVTLSIGETAKKIIINDEKDLQRSALIFGNSDECYQFLTSNNSEYIGKILTPSSLLSEGIHGILFFKQDRTFFYGVSYNDTTGAFRKIPGSVIADIQHNDLLFSEAFEKKGISGVVSTPDASYLIGSGPILPKDYSGDVQGVLVLFKDIDPELIQKYQEISGYPIQISSVLNGENNNINEQVTRINTTTIRYSTSISSPTASVPLIISIDLNRTFYLQQIEIFSTLLLFRLISGIIISVLLFLIISLSIIRPLTRLDKLIRESTHSGDLTEVTDIRGATEITSLASSFNFMVTMIHEKEERISQMAEERYRILIERASDAILIAEPSTFQIIDANIKADILFGSHSQPLKGRSLRDLHTKEELSDIKIFEAKRNDLLNGIIQECTVHNQGKIIEVELNASLVEIDDARYLLCFYRDITERKRIHAALIESEEMFSRMAAGTIVGIFLVQDGKFIYVNNRIATMFGYTRDEMIGRIGPADFFSPDDSRRYEIFDCNPEDHKVHRELCTDNRVIIKDGSIRIFRTYSSSIEYKGKPAVIGTTIDITRESELEHQRQVASRKIETIMEQHAIYNDLIRNPLSIISIKTDLVGGETMNEIQDQILLINKIIDQVDQGFLESAKIREYMKKHHFEDIFQDTD